MWPVPPLPGRGSSLECLPRTAEETSSLRTTARGEGAVPSRQLQAARQVWGQGSMPANPSVPLILGDHGGSWRDGTEATRGHQLPLPSTAVDWAPTGTRKHDRVAPHWGVTCPGTGPTSRNALPLLLETHPQALRATQSHLHSPRGRFMLCLGHERALRHVHDINPRGGKGKVVLVGQVFI